MLTRSYTAGEGPVIHEHELWPPIFLGGRTKSGNCMTANLWEWPLPLSWKRPGNVIQKIIDFAHFMEKTHYLWLFHCLPALESISKCPWYFVCKHTMTYSAWFTPLKWVVAVKLPLAALNLHNLQNIQFSCCNTVLHVYTSFSSYFDKYPAGEISGSARIVTLHQTRSQLALYSLWHWPTWSNKQKTKTITMLVPDNKCFGLYPKLDRWNGIEQGKDKRLFFFFPGGFFSWLEFFCLLSGGGFLKLFFKFKIHKVRQSNTGESSTHK